MTEQMTLLVVTAGRASLETTLRAACSAGRSFLAETLLLDNSPAGLVPGEVSRWVGGVPVRIIAGEPGGVGRNLLIEQARTDLVCFTDDDCLPDEGWIATLTAYLSAHPEVAAAFGKVLPVPRPGSWVREISIAGVGTVAWGEVGTGDDLLFCPSISAPSCAPGVARCNPSVPWAVVGSSNNLGIRRSLLLGGRPPFLTTLGPGSPAISGEDTEFGYALMAAGRDVAYVPEAQVLHDSWLDVTEADRKRRGYFRGNTEALAHHAMRGDRRAAELLAAYWSHFCEVNDFADPGRVLDWAYGTAATVVTPSR
jgi:glycosyl transferase family 2